MKRFLYKTILFVALFSAIERFCHQQTHGFRPYKVHSDHTPSPRWECSPLSAEKKKEIQQLLEQPYFFLASGGESYVFISKDRKTVLKVFKHHHMRENKWIDKTPLPTGIIPLRSYFRNARKKRRDLFFTSCKIAYEQFREGTGLLYLQLNPSSEWKKPIKLYDAIGVYHKLDPNIVPFALQKAAMPAYTTLTNLMDAGEENAAKARLSSLLNLVATRSSLGIADHDARKRNFGFVEEKAIEFDLGSFSLDPTLQSSHRRQRAFLLETHKLKLWVKKHHPTLHDFIETKIKENIETEKKIG